MHIAEQHTFPPLGISRHASPDYAPQFGIYVEGESGDLAIVGGRGCDNAAAYAALFAAAPEMLAALQGAVSFFENEPNLPGDGWMAAALRDARAAIAAATPTGGQ